MTKTDVAVTFSRDKWEAVVAGLEKLARTAADTEARRYAARVGAKLLGSLAVEGDRIAITNTAERWAAMHNFCSLNLGEFTQLGRDGIQFIRDKVWLAVDAPSGKRSTTVAESEMKAAREAIAALES